MSEPIARISRCRMPTALAAASSERNELEQTSSASRSVRMRGGPPDRPHLVQDDAEAGAGDLPGGFGAGEAAADDVDGLNATSAGSSACSRSIAKSK